MASLRWSRSRGHEGCVHSRLARKTPSRRSRCSALLCRPQIGARRTFRAEAKCATGDALSVLLEAKEPQPRSAGARSPLEICVGQRAMWRVESVVGGVCTDIRRDRTVVSVRPNPLFSWRPPTPSDCTCVGSRSGSAKGDGFASIECQSLIGLHVLPKRLRRGNTIRRRYH